MTEAISSNIDIALGGPGTGCRHGGGGAAPCGGAGSPDPRAPEPCGGGGGSPDPRAPKPCGGGGGSPDPRAPEPCGGMRGGE